MELGVQTHFSQGWSTGYLRTMRDAGIVNFRDEMLWKAIETAPGQFAQPELYAKYMGAAKAAGLDPIIELGYGNVLYDEGLTPYTDAGRQAFSKYAVATLKAYGGQIRTVEVWNEYNGGTFVSGPVTADRTHYYTLMMKEVYTAIKAEFPDVTVVGGSTVLVPVPYLEKLFDEGALDYMDAVSIHPYRPHPEGVEKEIAAVQRLMGEHGGIKPIYATEFGRGFDDPADVPAYMVKMAVLMASVDVEKAYWYPLRDNWSYVNMGLYDESMRPYPALSAFQFLQKEMPDGVKPERVDMGSERVHAFELKPGTHVVWGLENAVSFGGSHKLYDARGDLLDHVTTLTSDPIYVEGDFKLHIAESMILADTKMDFGQEGWSYFGRTSTGRMMELIDQIPDPNGWNYHLGLEKHPYLAISPTNMFPGYQSVDAVQRFTSPEAGTFEIEGSWSVANAKSNGVVANIVLNGKEIWSAAVGYGKPAALDGRLIELRSGDTLDIGVDSAGGADFDNTTVHVRLNRLPSDSTVFKGHEVRGTSASELLSGTAESDIFLGGAGNDRLSSSKDGKTDIFILSKGDQSDRIFNFEPGVDRLDLTAFGVTSLHDPGLRLTGTAHAILAIGKDQFVLNGVPLDEIRDHPILVQHQIDYFFV